MFSIGFRPTGKWDALSSGVDHWPIDAMIAAQGRSMPQRANYDKRRRRT
jgi:hypothetical protein